MKRKVRNRALSIVLALLVLLSSVSLSLPAAAAFVRAENYNSVDKAVLTPEQAATLILDYADKILAENGTVMTTSVPVLGSIVVDTTSIDKTLKSIDDLSVFIVEAPKIPILGPIIGALIGDLDELNFNAIKGKRRGSGNADLQLIKSLIQFAFDNRNFITKAVQGNIDLGIINSFVDVNEIIGDISEMIRGLIYDSLVKRDEYPLTYEQAKNDARFNTADALINTFITDLLTKPTSFDASSVDTGAILSTLSSFLSFLGLPVDLTGLSIADITKMITELMGLPGAEAVPALSPGAVIMPSLERSKIDLTRNSLYSVIEYVVNTAYTDLLALPLNNGLKQLLAVLSGAQLNEVVNTSLLSNLSKNAPKKSNAISNTDFFTYSGKQYVRTGDKYFEVNWDNSNDFYSVINWNYAFPNNLSGLGADTDFAKNANKLLYRATQTVFANSAFNSMGLVDGGNEHLNENINKLLKFILPKIPPETFGANFDTSLLENIENKSLEQLAALLLRGILQTNLPSLIIPSSVKTLEEMAILALREVLIYEAPHLKYDDRIFSNAAALELKNKTESEWKELLFEMIVDAAVFYLDQYAGLDFGVDKVLAKKNQRWTAVDFFDEIVDWALSYTKGILLVTNELNLTRGTTQNPWEKLNKVIESLVDLSFINNAGGYQNGKYYVLDTETFVKDKILGNLLNLNAADAVNMFVRNAEDGNILNDPNGMRGILKTVNKAIKAVLNTELSAGFLTSAESLIKKEGLVELVNKLIHALNSRANASVNNLLDAVLPFVASALPDVLTEQRFGGLKIDAPDYIVISSGSAKGTVKLTHSTIGVPDSYMDGTARKLDNDYMVRVTNVSLSASGGSTSFAPKDLAPGMSYSFEITVPAAFKDTVVKLTATYQVTAPNGANLGSFTEYTFIYVTDKMSDEEPRNLGNNVTGPLVTYLAKSEFSTKLPAVKFQYKAGDENELQFQLTAVPKTSGTNSGYVEAAVSKVSVAKDNTVTLKPYKLKSGTAYDPKFEGQTEITQKYNGKNVKTNIYVYNDYELIPLYNRLMALNYSYNDFAENFTYAYSYNGETGTINSSAAWSNYNAALQEAAGYILQPKTLDSVASVVVKYKGAHDKLLRAYEILKQCPYKANSPYDVLKTYLEENEKTGFEAMGGADYMRYRWTKYSAAKLLADTIITQKRLSNPENRLHLPGVNLTAAELKEIKNSSSQKYADVIRLYDDYAGSITGIASSIGNMLTESLILKPVNAADAKNMLERYSSRLIKIYTQPDKTYLSAAVDYAENTVLEAAAYAPKSYAAFTEALNDAKAALLSNNITQTAINNARTELLRAFGSLILKEELVPEDIMQSLTDARERAYLALDARNSLRVNPDDFAGLLEAAGLVETVTGKNVQLYPKSVGALENAELKNTASTIAEINRRIEKLDALIENIKGKQNANITLVSSADVDSALEANKTFTVEIKLGTDFKLKSAVIPVYFNDSALEYKSASGSAAAVKNGNVITLTLSNGGDRRYANEVIAALTFKSTKASDGTKLIWVENKSANPIVLRSALSSDGQSIILDSAALTFKAANAVVPSYGGTIVRGGPRNNKEAYSDGQGGYTAADFRIVSEISQAEALKYFGIPLNPTVQAYRSPIYELGTIVAFSDYMKSANLTTLTLNNVDNKNVFAAPSQRRLYTDRAKPDGSGSYYWAAVIPKVPKEKWNTTIYAVGYIKYYDANGNIKTVYTSGQHVSLSVESVALVK